MCSNQATALSYLEVFIGSQARQASLASIFHHARKGFALFVPNRHDRHKRSSR
jgi:hypothetical protein